MNLQHKLAQLFAKPLQEGVESEEEQALLVYGVEIVLNKLLKIIIIVLIAAIVRKMKIAVLGTCYLLLARRCSGGRHFDSNVMCTLFTIITAFAGPLGVSMIRVPSWLQIGAGIIETGLIYQLVPYAEEIILCDSQRKSRKTWAIIMFWSFMGIAGLLGGSGFLNAIIFIELIVILALINIKIYENK